MYSEHPHNDPKLKAIVGERPKGYVWCDECLRWGVGPIPEPEHGSLNPPPSRTFYHLDGNCKSCGDADRICSDTGFCDICEDMGPVQTVQVP